MVKGVNKSVIEMNCTDNGYFERAILFVSPEYSHLSQKRISAEAEKFVAALDVGLVLPDEKRREEGHFKAKAKKILLSLLLATVLITATVIFLNKL